MRDELLLNQVLDVLMEGWPLPEQWSVPERYFNRVSLETIEVITVGLVSGNDTFPCVTGSSAALADTNDPLLCHRAYFELLERVSVIEAIENPRPSFRLWDGKQAPCGDVERQKVFPVTPAGANWTFSKSNGVAAHTQFEKAATSALHEMTERDAVLGYWYQKVTPVFRADFRPRMNLPSQYDLKAYSFGLTAQGKSGFSETAGLFAFPKQDGFPLIYGFGCGWTWLEAVQSAERECIQRMAFLLNEEVPSAYPEFSPTPNFHQDYFLFPKNRAILESWLGRSEIGVPTGRQTPEMRTLDEVVYADLTPEHLKGRLFVLRALSSIALPLTFGYGNPKLSNPSFSEDWFIHPVV